MANPIAAINDPSHWDSVAERYAGEAARMTGLYADEAWDLAALPPGAKILDVATGTGALLVTALKHGADAVGIDFSPAMVRIAQEKASAVKPGEHAFVMDGQALEFEAASFDAAFSIFGVFMFPDPEAGFREIARTLRPGGKAVIAVWENAGGAGPAVLFQQAAAEILPDHAVPLPVSQLFNSPALLDAAFGKAGLEMQAVHSVKRSWPAPSADWFRENARLTFGWSPMWAELTEEQKTAFAERAGELAQELPPEGIWSTALVGIARKPG